jgi:membrane-associated phospholipid phosphatase
MDFQRACRIGLNPYFIGIWVLLGAISYFYLDLPIAVYFNHLAGTAPFIYHFFSVITHFGLPYPYFIFAGLLIIAGLFIKNKQLIFSGVYIFLSIIIALYICDLIKRLTGRARPILYFNDHLYGFYFWQHQNNLWSFPSGHTTLAFTVATAFSLLYPRWWGLFFCLAFLVGISRIIITMHYLSDVMAGFYFGFIIAYCLYLVFNTLRQKYA